MPDVLRFTVSIPNNLEGLERVFPTIVAQLDTVISSINSLFDAITRLHPRFQVRLIAGYFL